MSHSLTSLSARREVGVPIGRLFHLVATPGEHHRFDASTMVGQAITPQRLAKVGDIFTMEMTYRDDNQIEHYRTDNHVTVLDEPRCVEWAVAPRGEEPLGWHWRYELDQRGTANTCVTLTYDWADTPKKNMRRFGVPLFTEDELQASLAMLAEAAEVA